MKNISYFERVSDVTPAYNVDLFWIYDKIRSSEFKERTERIRAGLADKKKVLPAVTFAGTFSKRNKRGLSVHSSLICIDIDLHKDDPDFADSLKGKISRDDFLKPVLAFISPRRGVKIIIRVKDGSPDDHELYFACIARYLKGAYGIEADPSGRDICRLCFICHDPEPYFFEDGFVASEALLRLRPQPSVAEMVRDTAFAINKAASAAVRATLSGCPSVKPSERLKMLSAVHDRAVYNLQAHGWKRIRNTDYWTRPGKDSGVSAIYNYYEKAGCCIFSNLSSNAPVFDTKGYTDLDVIKMLEFNGDFKECIRTLSREYLN
jgi:hypothetical protein